MNVNKNDSCDVTEVNKSVPLSTQVTKIAQHSGLEYSVDLFWAAGGVTRPKKKKKIFNSLDTEAAVCWQLHLLLESFKTSHHFSHMISLLLFFKIRSLLWDTSAVKFQKTFFFLTKCVFCMICWVRNAQRVKMLTRHATRCPPLTSFSSLCEQRSRGRALHLAPTVLQLSLGTPGWSGPAGPPCLPAGLWPTQG